MQLEGYRIEKRVSSRAEACVYAAARVSDGLLVLLRAYPSTQSGVDRACAEAEALDQARGPGVVPLVELDRSTESPVVVVERVRGRSLRELLESEPLSVAAVLRIAVQLADALARVHAARRVLCAVAPHTIWVDPKTFEVNLVEFRLARTLGCPPLPADSRHLDELHYISPELSGRMGLGVGLASDLYSLGATLYAALIGHPPFPSGDPLEVIHGHIAMLAPAPRDLRPELPDALSRIVMKLLCKQPQDRYRTARALAADLRLCEAQWNESGSIPDAFVLGSLEHSERPSFGATLFGRDAEVDTLHAAFARVQRGARGFVAVKGGPGVGKSALAATLRHPVNGSAGYFIHGKFDLYRREHPYAGMADAIDGWVQQVLTEDDASLARLRERLVSGLGQSARVLADWIPDFALIVGDLPAVAELGAREAQLRLVRAVQRFLQVCSRPEHPLVLVLDDLQWADAASFELLHAIVIQGEARGLLIVATCRDEEITPDHPLPALLAAAPEHTFIEQIVLDSLSLDAVAQMLAAALHRSASETLWLAREIERKTGNSALFIRQFVDHLCECSWLRYQPEVGWTWDERQVAAAEIPEDAIALVVAKLDRVDPEVSAVLTLASCIGDEFDLSTIADLSDLGEPKVAQALYALIEWGLTAPCTRGYRFVHDRIREAAQSRMSEGERVRIHRRIALYLLERMPASQIVERAFDIADHMNRAIAGLSSSERRSAVQLNLWAGKRALSTGAPVAAETYLRMGRTLLDESEWDPLLGFDLVYHSAESAFQNREFGRALEILDVLEARELSTLQRGYVVARRAGVHASNAAPEDAVACMLAGLRPLGLRWSPIPGRMRLRWEMFLADWALRRVRAGQNMQRGTLSEHDAARMVIVEASLPSCNRVSARLATLVAFWRTRLFARRGYLDAPGLALLSYAVHRYWLQPAAHRTRLYIELGLRWSAEIDPPRLQLQAEFLNHAYIAPWHMSRSQTVVPLRELAKRSAEAGDLEYAYYCSTVAAYYRALAGMDVQVAQRELCALRGMEMMSKVFELLRDGAEDTDRVAAEQARIETVLAQYSVLSVQTRTFWMLLLCVLGRHAEAYEQAEHLGDTPLDRYPGLATVTDFCFFRALSAAVLASHSAARARTKLRRILRSDLRRLRIWAMSGPDYVHMTRFLEAERERLAGHSTQALRLYEAASRRADAQGYPHHSALAHERRSGLLRESRRETLADLAIEEALRRYASWGAYAKVRQIRAAEARDPARK